MCSTLKLINQSNNGKIYTCSNCETILLLFKNLRFDFYQQEYEHFINYIFSINEKELATKKASSIYSKNIVVPVGQDFFSIVIDTSELEELKQLILGEKEDELALISFEKINYNLNFN